MLSPTQKSTDRPAAQGLDLTFADGGIAYRFSAGSDPLQIIARRADGKMLLAGKVYWRDHLDFQLVQLLEDGDKDPDFANEGILKGGFKDGAQASLHGAQLYEDGKILVIGAHYGDIRYLAFARFLEDGTRDSSFGDDGLVLHPESSHPSGFAKPSSSQSQPTSNTAIGPNGEIIMASWTEISRYDQKGEPDLSFNGTGHVSVEFVINAVGVSDNGRITVVGSSSLGSNPLNEGVIARFNADGTQDESFGIGGITRVRVDDAATAFSGLLLRVDGSSFVTGSLDRTPNDVWGTDRRGVVTAFNGNGRPNLVFNSGRPVVSELSSGEANSWSDISGDPTHGIVVVGLSGLRSRERTLIARYDITGNPDSTFGIAGFLQTRLGADHEYWTSVVVQPDHKIIASGDCRYHFDRATIARFLATNG